MANSDVTEECVYPISDFGQLKDRFDSIDARVALLDDENRILGERLDDFDTEVRREFIHNLDNLKREVDEKFRDVWTDQVRQDADLGQTSDEINRTINYEIESVKRELDNLALKQQENNIWIKRLGMFNFVVGVSIVALACYKIFC